MKIKNIKHLFLFFFIFCVFTSCSSNEISVSDVKWSCFSHGCTVKYTVQNSLPSSVEPTVIIRGYQKFGGSRNTGIKNVGETKLKVKLSPNEIRKFEKTIKFKRVPSYVVVKLLDK